jgi:hypothetical protein
MSRSWNDVALCVVVGAGLGAAVLRTRVVRCVALGDGVGFGWALGFAVFLGAALTGGGLGFRNGGTGAKVTGGT